MLSAELGNEENVVMTTTPRSVNPPASSLDLEDVPIVDTLPALPESPAEVTDSQPVPPEFLMDRLPLPEEEMANMSLETDDVVSVCTDDDGDAGDAHEEPTSQITIGGPAIFGVLASRQSPVKSPPKMAEAENLISDSDGEHGDQPAIKPKDQEVPAGAALGGSLSVKDIGGGARDIFKTYLKKSQSRMHDTPQECLAL